MKAIRDRYASIAQETGKRIARDMVGLIDSAALAELARLMGTNQSAQSLSQWLSSARTDLDRSSWAMLGVAAMCESIAMSLPNEWPRVVLFASSTISAAMAYRLGHQSRLLMPLLATVNQLESARVMDSLLSLYTGASRASGSVPIIKSASPTVLESSISPNSSASDRKWSKLTFFDWNELKNGDLYPHLLILGATGSGKTYTTERVVRYLCPNASRVKVITPKRKANQWQGWQVIGPVREFDHIKLELESLVDEMTLRLEQIDDPNLFEQWVIWDEVPSMAANISNLGEYTSTLIRESREAKIRTCSLVQGTQVKLLGLEGQSDLRENLTYVRLGKFAKLHAAKLVKDGDADPLLLQWVNAQERPILVEDSAAYLPPEVQQLTEQHFTIPPHANI